VLGIAALKPRRPAPSCKVRAYPLPAADGWRPRV